MPEPTTSPAEAPFHAPHPASGTLGGKWLVWAAAFFYLLLVLASHLWIATRPEPSPPVQDDRLVLPVMTDGGPLGGVAARVSIKQWGDPNERPSVVLLHGSPGSWSGFAELGPRLQQAGYHVVAPDLPGFGQSDKDLPDLSARSHAFTVLAMLDALGTERSHLVGWSNGGAVALHAAEIAPERAASLTLMASIGVRQAEGSGSHFFEHAKYKLGLSAHAALRWFTPHFGALNRDDIAWLRNFDDSDLRPIEAMMRTTRTPTLILHGRHDFLTPAWGAELHHRLMPESRLVMLDASHFIPFMQAEEAAAYLIPHLDRHDAPGAMARTDVVDLAAVGQPNAVELLVRSLPWWALVVLIALLTARRPELAAAVVAVLALWLWLDVGVGLLGLFIGMLEFHGRGTKLLPGEAALWIRRAHAAPARSAALLRFMPWERRAGLSAGRIAAAPSLGWAAGSLIGTGLWIALTQIAAVVTVVAIEPGLGWLPGMAQPIAVLMIACVAVRAAVQLVTRVGRQRFAARLARLWTHEFWPSWAYYLLISPKLISLAARHGPMTWTCANPGMPMGGGIVGESKAFIQNTLERAGGSALTAKLVKPGPSPRERARTIASLVGTDPALGGWPVILKPNSGMRGFGVRRARSVEDAERYCRSMPRAIVVQRYHPGPREFGVLWHREPDGTGALFGITTKTLPVLIADGERTREQLVLTDHRLRLQAGVLLARLAADRDTIDSAGARIELGIAGNHAQGCRFDDGSALVTLELCAALTELAETFEHGRMDFGRFDLRCETEDQLRRGEDLAVIELNGTTSEATHLYAPGRPLAWRLGILRRQWDLLFAIGARRRAESHRPVRLVELLGGLVEHYRGLPGEHTIR